LLDKLTFLTSASDNAAVPTDWVCDDEATYAIYDVTDMSTNLLGVNVPLQVGGCATDILTTTVDFTGTGVSISASSSRTFVLKFDTNAGTDPSGAADDSLRVDIINTNDTAVAGTDVQWSDGVATSNGYKVESLPVNGGNIQF
jgi:hypothetical protein